MRRPKRFADQLWERFAELSSDHLPLRHRLVLLAVGEFCGPDGTGARPALETIMRRAGMGRTPLGRVLRGLEGARWLVRHGAGPKARTFTLKLDGGPIAASEADRASPSVKVFTHAGGDQSYSNNIDDVGEKGAVTEVHS